MEPKPLGRAAAVVADGGGDADTNALQLFFQTPVLSLGQRHHRLPSLPAFGTIITQHTEKDSCCRGQSTRDEASIGSSETTQLGALLCSRGAGFCDAVWGWVGRCEGQEEPIARLGNFFPSLSAGLLSLGPPEEKVSVGPVGLQKQLLKCNLVQTSIKMCSP